MAASVLLASRDALKRYLGIGGSDGSQDALLDALLAGASERIETYCRRRFAMEELEEFYDGPGTALLVLRRRPVVELDALYEDIDGDFGEESLVPPQELILYPNEGIIRRLVGVFPAAPRSIKVKYTAGYSSIPDDLSVACLKLAASWFAHSSSGSDGLKRESLGDYSAEYERAPLPEDVESILGPYREPASG